MGENSWVDAIKFLESISEGMGMDISSLEAIKADKVDTADLKEYKEELDLAIGSLRRVRNYLGRWPLKKLNSSTNTWDSHVGQEALQEWYHRFETELKPYLDSHPDEDSDNKDSEYRKMEQRIQAEINKEFDVDISAILDKEWSTQI
jgi:hypothetical protein